HLIQTVQRLRPSRTASGDKTIFTGWARYAVPIYSFQVRKILKPLLGEITPEKVTAEITVDLSPFSGGVRNEWEEIKIHDVLFLLTVQAPKTAFSEAPAAAVNSQAPHHRQQQGDQKKSADLFALARQGASWQQLNQDHLGITFIRGAEVTAVLDEKS